MRKNVFLSTGGFYKENVIQVVNFFIKNKIFNIELSGGPYEKNVYDKLIDIKKSFNINFLIHNYFPVPKNPFVINLASFNKVIEQKSINQIFSSIKLCSTLNIRHFSLHAGFRLDPKPRSLGKKFKKIKLNKRTESLNRFKTNVIKICEYAKAHKVKILIENNVTSINNLNTFDEDPFLLSHPKEIIDFFIDMKNSCSLLLDVSHLKVTSKSLGFDLNTSHQNLKKFISGYHLSDNNFIDDNNSLITNNSWFLKNLKKNANFYTIEVYSKDINLLKKQLKLVSKFI
jgi:sugar phosphate isomerase/epimerase